MLNFLSFFAPGDEGAYTYFIVKIVLAALMLVCAGFIIFVVMKQSGNSDGMEAMTGSSKSDSTDSYYNKNSAERKEAKLKTWTYICAGLLALCAIAFLILTAVIG
ncbi:MAG: preprotein translocase subunit SecG [Corallococcus sp.]|nr:preprotein translocase subunit SecG [Corallococcus sp.]